MKPYLFIALLCITPLAQAFSWQDLWVTKNRQAQTMMDAGQFSQAQDTFDDPAWIAAATYRAGNYKEAAIRYQSLKNSSADTWYNLGNALAQSGQLKSALAAYDQALAQNANNPDALHNRKIVEELLEKKDDQNKQNQNKQDQDKQDQNKQNQDKQDQDKQDQDKQDQDKQDRDKQAQDKQAQDKQDQDKQDQDKQNQEEKDQDNQDPNKLNQKKQDVSSEKQLKSKIANEQQQAKEQWLQLIPDDPSGLLREKFLRDYLRRQHEPS